MRLTIDMDYSSELRRLMTYFNARRFGEVYIERGPRGHGDHMIVRGLPPDRELEYVLRSMLGDDFNRIKFDWEAPNKPTRILFEIKEVMGERYVARPLDERNVLALPWKSNLHRGVYVRG